MDSGFPLSQACRFHLFVAMWNRWRLRRVIDVVKVELVV
jgi:hypothetical protein